MAVIIAQLVGEVTDERRSWLTLKMPKAVPRGEREEAECNRHHVVGVVGGSRVEGRRRGLFVLIANCKTESLCPLSARLHWVALPVIIIYIFFSLRTVLLSVCLSVGS